MINGYSNFELVGRGGFSRVYRATQDAFGRVVAVKILDVMEATDERNAAFAKECRAVGSLHWHPNIITVFDAGLTDDGRPFIVMEFASGGSLAQQVASVGRNSESAVRDLGSKIASALQAAHDAGILHRDVKPGNILLNSFAQPLLADFGIAAITDATQTKTGNIAATLAHAAPEVLNGDRATAASDIYSLASTLFALFAGHAPFSRGSGDSAIGVITKVLTGEIPDLRQRGASDDFASAIERGLDRDPAKRFANASDFGAALSAGSILDEVTSLRITEGSPPDDADRTTLRDAAPTEVALRQAHVVTGETPVPNDRPAQRGSRRVPAIVGITLLAIVIGAIWISTLGTEDGSSVDAATTVAARTTTRRSIDTTTLASTTTVPGATSTVPGATTSTFLSNVIDSKPFVLLKPGGLTCDDWLLVYAAAFDSSDAMITSRYPDCTIAGTTKKWEFQIVDFGCPIWDKVVLTGSKRVVLGECAMQSFIESRDAIVIEMGDAVFSELLTQGFGAPGELSTTTAP